jgi:hypothetical protein
MAIKKACGSIFSVLFGLSMIGISVWLGVASLVPENPFNKRNIATGVCLIVFATLIGIVAAFFGFGFGFILGCCLECTPYCLENCYDSIINFSRNIRNKNVPKIVTGIPVIDSV